MDKVLCSKQEAAEILGVSVRTVDNLVSRKLVESRRLGRRRLIVCASLARLAKGDTLVITGVEPARDQRQ